MTRPLATLLFAGLLAAVPTAQVAPSPAPAAPPPRAVHALLDVVPAGATAAWSWRAGPDTARFEQELLTVVDAVAAAQFDLLAFDTLAAFGVPDELLVELRSGRNVIATVGALVPWRELVRRECVVAELGGMPLVPDLALPSLLVVARPGPGRTTEAERTLAGFLGAVGAGSRGLLRYDIDQTEDDDGTVTRLYALRFRPLHDRAVLQLAVRDGTFLVGLGQEAFEASLALLRGGHGPRLDESDRWRQAFDGLPADVAGRSFLDVHALSGDLEDAADALAARQFTSGLWAGLLDDTFGLVQTLDTHAATLRCEGDRVLTETLTRFDPTALEGQPLARSGLPGHLSGELLDYVPADALSLTARGDVDLVPAWRWLRGRVEARWSLGEDALWAFDVAQAGADLYVERDLLSWLGSEHLTVTLPARSPYAAPDATESVVLCRLRDPESARRCLERIERVAAVAAPRVLGSLQDTLREMHSPIVPEVHWQPDAGPLPGLRRLTLELGGWPIPPLTYGVMGNLLVASTSQQALLSCVSVAAGEEDGIEARPLLASLRGREHLAGLELAPVGRQVRETVVGLSQVGGFVRMLLGQAAQGSPRVAAIRDALGTLIARVDGVLTRIDFLGDALTTSEVRRDGNARYERTVQELVPATTPVPSAPLADQATR